MAQCPPPKYAPDNATPAFWCESTKPLALVRTAAVLHISPVEITFTRKKFIIS